MSQKMSESLWSTRGSQRMGQSNYWNDSCMRQVYLRCIQEKFVQIIVCPEKHKVNMLFKGSSKRIRQLKINCETGNSSRLIWYETFHWKIAVKYNHGSVSCSSWSAYNGHRTSLLSSLKRSLAITVSRRLFGVHWWKISVNRGAFRPLKTRYLSYSQQNRRESLPKGASHNSVCIFLYRHGDSQSQSDISIALLVITSFPGKIP